MPREAYTVPIIFDSVQHHSLQSPRTHRQYCSFKKKQKVACYTSVGHTLFPRATTMQSTNLAETKYHLKKKATFVLTFILRQQKYQKGNSFVHGWYFRESFHNLEQGGRKLAHLQPKANLRQYHHRHVKERVVGPRQTAAGTHNRYVTRPPRSLERYAEYGGDPTWHRGRGSEQ